MIWCFVMRWWVQHRKYDPDEWEPYLVESDPVSHYFRCLKPQPDDPTRQCGHVVQKKKARDAHRCGEGRYYFTAFISLLSLLLVCVFLPYPQHFFLWLVGCLQAGAPSTAHAIAVKC